MNNLEQAQDIAKNILKNVDRVCRDNGIEYFICAGTLLGAYRHGGFIPWDDDIDIAMTREDYEKFKKIAQNELGEDFFVQTSDTDKNYDIFHVEMKIRDNNSIVIEDKEHKYHCGVFLDVFAMDYIPNNKIVRNIQRNLAMIISNSDIIVNVPYKGLSIKNKILYPIYWFISKKVSFNKRRRIIKIISQLSGNDKNIIGYGLDSIWKTNFNYSDIYPTKEIKFNDLIVKAPNNIHNILSAEYGINYMELPPERERIPAHFKGVEVLNKKGKYNHGK